MAGLAGVPQGAVQPGEADGVPGEGVVMIIVGSVGDWIVTVPEDALQLAGHQAVVLVPQAVRADEGGGGGGRARPSYEVPPVLTLPPAGEY